MAMMFGQHSVSTVSCGVGLLMASVLLPQQARANCSSATPGSGVTVTCDTAAPNPDTTGVNAVAGSTNVTINVTAGASVAVQRSTSPTALSVIGSSQITNNGTVNLSGSGGTGGNRGAAMVGMANANTLTNNGTIATAGAFNDGMAANGSNNALINNGAITTTGPNAYGMTAAWGQTNVGQTNNNFTNIGSVTTNGSNARAVSILGGNGTITNIGSLTTNGFGSATVFMQGNNDTLINSGTIRATGTGATGVFSNTVGSSFTVRIENRAGGQIISDQGPAVRTLNGAATVVNAGLIQSGAGIALGGGNGSVTFTLQTGSQIVGLADGGGGANQVLLQGSGLVDNAFMRFQTLTMQGTDWTWNGTGDFANTFVDTGILRLQSALTGNATVAPGATLEASAQTLTPTVTNNGLLRFAQPGAGTYAGAISGTGVVEKTGAGVLTLAPAAVGGNTYSGGTIFTAGTVAVGADNALGAPIGGLTFNGGTLQFASSFDLAATRPIALTAAGGTIDTQGFSTTIAQGVTGTGALTKLGSGILTMNGNNPYRGGTSVAAGTLIVGDATHPAAALSGSGPVNVTAGATLGGYGSVSGTVVNNGTIAAANAALAGGPIGNFTINGTLQNNSIVNLAGSSVGNSLTVVGNYVGNSQLLINTVLGPDNSASDKLIVSGGSATGTTGITVNNAGGTGARSLSDGILVVQAVNGATTAASAFSLSRPVSAGAYEYVLFKGGVSSGTGDNWYLRSTVVAGPTAAPGSPPLPAPAPDGKPVPLFRPEVPLYSAIPPTVRQLGLAALGTFHERRGEQSFITSAGLPSAAWARVFGQHMEQKWGKDTSPSLNANIAGVQAGLDFFAQGTTGEHRDQIGLFFGYSALNGTVNGFAIGQQDVAVGSVSVNGYSLGAYWTHIGPSNWYTDLVLMNTWVNANPLSTRNIGTTSTGNIITASLEAGYPIALTSYLTLEPQVQAIWQHLSLGSSQDRISTIGFAQTDTAAGRLGVRLQGSIETGKGLVQPFVTTNLWYGSAVIDNVTFAGTDAIPTAAQNTTSFEVRAGLSATLSKFANVYASVGYATELTGDYGKAVKGRLGMRVTW
jgi:outer membrane autotransporter protein